MSYFNITFWLKFCLFLFYNDSVCIFYWLNILNILSLFQPGKRILIKTILNFAKSIRLVNACI